MRCAGSSATNSSACSCPRKPSLPADLIRMCGIAGIGGTSGVNQRIYDGLRVLQHRGQDAAGIAKVSEGELFVRKGQGLVRDVFEQRHMQELKGNMGMGHVRYPTAGADNASEAQPFYVNAPY